VHSVDRVVSILHAHAHLGAAGVTESAAEAGVHKSTVVPAGGDGQHRPASGTPVSSSSACIADTKVRHYRAMPTSPAARSRSAG